MISEVYDIEGAVEDAVALVLNTALTVATPQSSPDFQSKRPRAEVVCNLGSGRGHYQDVDAVSEIRLREDVWMIRINVVLITEPNMETHAQLRALLRKTMAELPWTVTAEQLPDHVLSAPMRHAGSSPILKPEDGYYMTRMDFTTDVSVRSTSWAKLNT